MVGTIAIDSIGLKSNLLILDFEWSDFRSTLHAFNSLDCNLDIWLKSLKFTVSRFAYLVF